MFKRYWRHYSQTNDYLKVWLQFLLESGTYVNNKARISAGKSYKGDNNALRNNWPRGAQCGLAVKVLITRVRQTESALRQDHCCRRGPTMHCLRLVSSPTMQRSRALCKCGTPHRTPPPGFSINSHNFRFVPSAWRWKCKGLEVERCNR